MWKVYNIATGKIMKAGFETDEQAKEWLERRKDLPDDEHDIDEMDEEEEEEFLDGEEGEEEEAEADFEPEFEEGDDMRDISYPDEDLEEGDDEEEDEEEAEEEDDDDY